MNYSSGHYEVGTAVDAVFVVAAATIVIGAVVAVVAGGIDVIAVIIIIAIVIVGFQYCYCCWRHPLIEDLPLRCRPSCRHHHPLFLVSI